MMNGLVAYGAALVGALALASSSAAAQRPAPFRPTLFIEHDADGTAYLRVEEQTFDAFAPQAPQRTISDRALGPAPGRNFRINGAQSTMIENVAVEGMKYGLQLVGSGRVSIRAFRYTRFDGGSGIYGAAIKIGDNRQPPRGATFIQRVFADGAQSPDPSYRVSNTDFIGIERHDAPVLIRDVTGRRFGDAGIDAKAGRVLVMNATLEGAHRMLRVWHGADVTLVNSIVNAAPGRAQVWFRDGGATLRYYNVLWCQGAEDPSPSDPNCRSAPWAIEGETISPAAAARRIIELNANPLPAQHSFFATRIDRIRIEYSRDRGGTWRGLELANTGENGAAPVGDPRYRLPPSVSGSLIRAWYERDGERIGAISQIAAP